MAAITIDPEQVAKAHDAMADEYDQLDDMWYPWLFSQIHEFIARHLPDLPDGRPTAVDVGCGTGLQSFLLARAGFDVQAFDIATKLIDVARRKAPEHARAPLEAPPLFQSSAWRGLADHHRRLSRRLEAVRGARPVTPPSFFHGDILSYEFGSARFDVVNCCGSVVSFVDRYEEAIHRMAVGLCRGGLMFLEVEQKRNLDLLWPVVDRLSGGRLHYDQRWREILANLFSRPGRSARVDYPFELADGREVTLPIWILSVRELARIFRRCGLVTVDRIGIHWLTNFIPSTVLHEAEGPAWVRAVSARLERMERPFAGTWPMWRLGCSALFCLRKV